MRLALVAALVLLVAAPAHAQRSILEPADAEELAQSLAEATDEQGVCYGWRVSVDDESGNVFVENGSSFGPGGSLDPNRCESGRYVELVGNIDYTSETSEAEDSASYSIQSNLDRPPTVGELRDLGHGPGRLLDEDDDEALTNAVGALPALVADHGEAKPVPFETSTLPNEQRGEPTGGGGSDFLREHGALFFLCLIALLGGIAWLVLALLGRAGGTARWIGKQMTED